MLRQGLLNVLGAGFGRSTCLKRLHIIVAKCYMMPFLQCGCFRTETVGTLILVLDAFPASQLMGLGGIMRNDVGC
ncbi:hypothetical protein VNO77_24875 [Canavalia gladiata]|uniref:Uncharacterized protein n=1 Tax=Canavalia gladiata TaxID=3824 RepID=A0AAN9QD09_CANGL